MQLTAVKWMPALQQPKLWCAHNKDTTNSRMFTTLTLARMRAKRRHALATEAHVTIVADKKVFLRPPVHVTIISSTTQRSNAAVETYVEVEICNKVCALQWCHKSSSPSMLPLEMYYVNSFDAASSAVIYESMYLPPQWQLKLKVSTKLLWYLGNVRQKDLLSISWMSGLLVYLFIVVLLGL